MERQELQQYFNIIRRWLWLVFLCGVLAAAVAYFASSRQIPVYGTASTVMLDTSPASQGSAYQELLTTQRLTSTYVELMKRPSIRERVLEELGYRPSVLRIAPAVSRDTPLMSVRVESDDPEAAAFIANTLPLIVGAEQRDQASLRYAETKESLQEEIDSASQEIATLQVQLADAVGEDERSEADSALSLAQSSFDALQSRLTQVRLQEAQEADLLTVVEPANTPRRPFKPKPINNSLLAGAIGGLLALAMGFLIEYFDNTVKADTNIGELLGTTSLAMVGITNNDANNPERRTLINQLPTHAPIAEAYRMLRTNLRFVSVDESLNSFVVSSPGPGEGKSTTAANFAIVLACAGHDTILVDVDLRKPVQHKIFELDKNFGLTMALSDREVPIEEMLQPTEIPNLRVLTCGAVPPNPSELVGSQRMREVVSRLKGLAEYVVFDSPPILAVSDTSLLASHADGVIVVLRANQTTTDAAQRAVEQLNSVKARVLGTVLNGVQQRRGGYYYYYYNQYYGDNQDHEAGNVESSHAQSAVAKDKERRLWKSKFPSLPDRR